MTAKEAMAFIIAKIVTGIKKTKAASREIRTTALQKIAANPTGTKIVADGKIRFALYVFLGLALLGMFVVPSSSKEPSLLRGLILFGICWLIFIGAKRSEGTTSEVLAYSGVCVLIFSILMFTGFYEILHSYLNNMPFNRGEGWFFLGGIGLIWWSRKIEDETIRNRLSSIGYIFILGSIAIYVIRHTFPGFDLQPTKDPKLGTDGTWFHWDKKPSLNDPVVIGGVAIAILSWYMFNTKRHVRGILAALVAVPLLFMGIGKYYPDLDSALRKGPLVKFFLNSDNATEKKKGSKNSIFDSASRIIEKKMETVTHKMDGDSSRDLTVSRIYAQKKKTWAINPETAIYSCTEVACVSLNLNYAKLTEVVSQGEGIEVNGVIYEKFSLPDPKTGQPGAIIGFIPSGKFMEKDEAEANSRKTVFVRTLDFKNSNHNEVPVRSFDTSKRYMISGKTLISFDNGKSYKSTDKPFRVPEGVLPSVKNLNKELVEIREVISAE